MLKIRLVCIALAIGVIALWWYALCSDWKHELDTLFSGLAFVGIIYSLLVQGHEIKESGKAQERSQTAMSNQLKIMNAAALLNGYNTLLAFYEKHRDQSSDNPIRSKETLERIEKVITEIQSLKGIISGAEGLK